MLAARPRAPAHVRRSAAGLCGLGLACTAVAAAAAYVGPEAARHPAPWARPARGGGSCRQAVLAPCPGVTGRELPGPRRPVQLASGARHDSRAESVLQPLLGLLGAAAALLCFAAVANAAEEVAGFAEFAAKGGAMDVNPTCFVTSCGKQTKECFAEDSRCLKGALCLSRCRGGQECATQCFAEFGCKRLDAWLNCTVEREKCVSVPPQLIDVNRWFTENVPKKLPNFDPATMQGRWYKVRGYNSKYDCYLCQPNTFDYKPGAKTMAADIQLRVPKIKSGGFWQNNVQENLVISPEADRSTFRATGEMFGLSFDEEWYVLAGDEDYKLVAYKGKNLQDIYEGAFVYTRSPALPANVEAKARAAAEANGYVWSKFCVVDNSCPAQAAALDAPAKLDWEDIPDLIEWFAPGTVPKKQFNGEYS